MVFNSIVFAIFLPIVLVVYYRLSTRAQNVWLLVASYIFYGWWDWRFLGLLGFTTIVDFIASNRIGDATNPEARRRWLLASMTANLAILGTFKYFNFFAGQMAVLLKQLGIEADPVTLRLVLPIGISFYTFQEMSYVIDVYRGEIKATRSLINFALFVCYFPHMVAGPIQRAAHLLTQIERPRCVSGNQIREGGTLIFIGLFKKVAIADAMAPFVEMNFVQPASLSGGSLLLGLYLFAIQIYCDFSGYTDVARGVSKLLGIELMLNFRQPYFATSITEFWRRWHISLSTWLRDYLYIPLGGNKRGELKTYRNLMLTMLLGGLWHGANWTFVIWGGLHGLYLAGHKLLLGMSSPAGAREHVLVSFMKGIATFTLVCLAWVFFRASSLGAAWVYLTRILSWAPGDTVFGEFDILRFCVLTLSLLCIDVSTARSQAGWQGWAAGHWVYRGALYGSAAVVWVVLGGVDAQIPFIYFQF